MHAQTVLHHKIATTGQRSTRSLFFKSPRPACIFDLGQKRCALEHGQILPLKESEPYDAKAFYFSEFLHSFECGTLDISGEKKYSGLVARRQLENEGRLDTDGYLHIYAQQQLDSHLFRIFFQIFDRTSYLSLFQKCENSRQGILIYDPISMLFGLMNAFFGKRDHLLIFHSHQSLFGLFGRKNKPVFLQKYIVNGPKDQGLNNALQSVETDLMSLSRQGRQCEKIVWVEHLCSNPELRLPELSLPVTTLPMERFDSQKTSLWSAVPRILHQLPRHYAIGPRHEKRIWFFEAYEKWMYFSFVILSSILLFSIFNLHKDISWKRVEIERQTQKNTNIHNEIETLLTKVVSVDSEKINSLQDMYSIITRCEDQTAFLQVWNDLASHQPPCFKLHEMKLSNNERQQVITLSGHIESQMFEAQQVFSDYIHDLQNMGFQVINQNFDISLDKITYSIQAMTP